MSKKKRAIQFLARYKALDSVVAEKIMNTEMTDGGPGSGNFGHAGRPGKRGGSAPENGGGASGPGNVSGSGSSTKTPETPGSFSHVGRPGKAVSTKTGEKYTSNPAGGEMRRGVPPTNGGASSAPIPKKKRTLSPVHEKRSLATRDNKTLQRLKAFSKNPEAAKKELDKMKPGSMIRLDERGYSVFEKKPDGSWVYQKYHEGEQPVSPEEVVKSMQSTGVQAVSAPKKGEKGRSQYWDSVRAVAKLEPNAGDEYTGRRVSFSEAVANGEKRAKGELGFPKEKGKESEKYTKEEISEDGVIHSTGQASAALPKGTGVTKISRKDLMKANPDDLTYNTLQEHCVENADGELVLTPEREKLHQAIVEEVFEGAVKPGPGEPKVMTFMGGGSAAGKGTIQSSGVAGLPDKEHSPVIDADEFKKRIPEYVDTAFSEDHGKAASMGHEESSALVGRAMKTAIANGYSFTLDGTGDGNVDKQVAKIKMAQANGYVVKGCYVTCPTEMAVKRNEGRSKTDEYNRLVPEAEVRRIHARVSGAFEKVAEAMDECSVYDTSGDKPVLICKYEKGKPVYKDEKRYKAFIDKKAEEEIAKAAAEAKKKG